MALLGFDVHKIHDRKMVTSRFYCCNTKHCYVHSILFPNAPLNAELVRRGYVPQSADMRDSHRHDLLKMKRKRAPIGMDVERLMIKTK